MAKSKYSKFFITETSPNPLHPQTRNKVSNFPWMNTLYINEELQKVKGVLYLETNIVLRPIAGGEEEGSKPHYHPFDEYLMFLGMDPDDPFKLGGEVEFWIEEEKHIITRTCAIFVPKGIYHCPFYIRKVDRPFMFITTGNTSKYAHMAFSDDPKYSKYMFLDEIAEFTVGGKKHKITRTYADYLRWLNDKTRETSLKDAAEDIPTPKTSRNRKKKAA
jgi:hypothetical protein